MKFLNKTVSFVIIIFILLINLAPAVMAQSVLDDIKGTLESEGITVIDYSSPEGAWGSLPKEWISYLSKEGYSNLEDIAKDLKSDFNDIAILRRDLFIAVGEKSMLTIDSEIEDKNITINKLEEDIKNLEKEIKRDIGIKINSVQNLNKETGKNLLFNEIDFYFNYKKWGRLPTRIIKILEAEFTGEDEYKTLQDILDLNDLSKPEGIRTLSNELSNIDNLSKDDVDLIINSTLILMSNGEAQLQQVGITIANTIKNLAGGLAVIWIIIAGARMVLAQGDENTITEQKKAILFGVIGLVTILLVDRSIDALYGAPGVIRTELTPDTAFSNEVYGVITFIKAIVGTVAILFIVVSGIKMLVAQGEEEQITKQKRTILYIAIGLIMLAIDRVIINNIFIIPTQQSDQIKSSNITRLINLFGTVIQFILGFVGLIALGALIYGGATMIMNYGNDEMVEKSKKIIKNAVIGILVILSAYTIVASLVVFK